MSVTQYNRIANICILVVIAAALLSETFPEYKVLFGCAAVLAAIAAATNYFRNQWLSDFEAEDVSSRVGEARVFSAPRDLQAEAAGRVLVAQLHEELLRKSLRRLTPSDTVLSYCSLKPLEIQIRVRQSELEHELLAVEELTKYLHAHFVQSSTSSLTDSFSVGGGGSQRLKASVNKLKGKGKSTALGSWDEDCNSAMAIA